MDAEDVFEDIRDEVFAQSVASQALEHPDWELDHHVQQLMDAGFAPDYVSRHHRAILEAMHKAREMSSSS